MTNDRLIKALADAQRIAREDSEKTSKKLSLVSDLIGQITRQVSEVFDEWDSDLESAYARGVTDGRAAERERLTAEFAELVRVAEMIASSGERRQAIRQVFAPLLGEENKDA